MDENIDDNRSEMRGSLWLRRLWAALPFMTLIVLLGIIFVLQSWINTEGNIVKERKAQELAGEKPPVNVVTLTLSPKPIREQISLPGVVRPWVDLSVVAEVRGKIVTKKVVEGQQVRTGDLLAVIDKRNYQNAYNSARAAYHAAKASYDRILTLNQDRLTTMSQLDDALASMENAKANMDTAALNLERCTITSPLDGIVDRVYIEYGQFMNDADPVADILQMDRVKVQVNIPESDVDAVRRVDDFKVTVAALGHKVFAGKRHYLAKSAQTLARSYLLAIAIDNSDGEILPDMFTRVKIVKQKVEDGLAIPLFTISSVDGQKGVFIDDDGVARRVPIKTGIQEGWQVQAKEGLTEGANVIVVGHKDVEEGAPIHVLRTVTDAKELMQ